MNEPTHDVRQDAPTDCTAIFERLWLRFGEGGETTVDLRRSDDLVGRLRDAQFDDFAKCGDRVGDSNILVRYFGSIDHTVLYIDDGDGTNADALSALRSSAAALLRTAAELERIMKAAGQ